MTSEDWAFFETRHGLRSWLEAHHDRRDELWIGFYKKASGLSSITYLEALEEALCFGWIDGVRYSIDEVSYRQRFTPRRKGSNWSAINIRKVELLTEQGLMHEAGLRAFQQRDNKRGGTSYEGRAQELPREYLLRMQASERAWQFYSSQAPWYRRAAAFWVMDAKKPETRERRLAGLIADSEAGRRIRPLSRPGER